LLRHLVNDFRLEIELALETDQRDHHLKYWRTSISS
jgi:hypothetical protein